MELPDTNEENNKESTDEIDKSTNNNIRESVSIVANKDIDLKDMKFDNSLLHSVIESGLGNSFFYYFSKEIDYYSRAHLFWDLLFTTYLQSASYLL